MFRSVENMDVGLSLDSVCNVTDQPGLAFKEEDEVKFEGYGHMIAYQDDDEGEDIKAEDYGHMLAYDKEEEQEKPFAELDCKAESDNAELTCHIVKVEVKKEEDEQEHTHLMESKSL